MSLIKLASPRWLKEFKSNPNLVNKFINAVQVDKFSPVKLTKNNMINRKLSKILFNNRSNDELKLPLKLRNNLTFKHNGKYIRQENNKNLINLEYDREEIKGSYAWAIRTGNV